MYESVEELRKIWRLYIKHGALVTRILPVPGKGERLAIQIRPEWGGEPIYLTGTVVQPSPAMSVLQLDDLEITARVALVSHGIEDAAPPPSVTSIPAVSAPAPAPPTTPAPDPDASADTVSAPDVGTLTAGEATATAPEATLTASQPRATPKPRGDPDPTPPRLPRTGPLPGVPTSTGKSSKPAAARPLAQRRGAHPIRQGGPSSGAFRQPPASDPLRKRPGSGANLARVSVTGESADMDALSASRLTGPVSPDTEAVLPTVAAAGDFGTEGWRDVLLDLFSDRATGVVVIHAFRENRWCYVVDGRPTHYLVDHAHPGEYLSDAILRGCEVSAGQWTEALVGAKISGVAPGDYLVKRGIITTRELHEALRRRASAITRNLLTANFGNWSYHPWLPVRDLFTWEPIDLLPLLLAAERATMERMTDEAITKLTAPHLDKHVSVASERKELLAQLPLDGAERTLAQDLLPGGWTMKEMLVHGGLAEKELLRFVWVLKAMGFVRLRTDEGADSKRNRAERKLYVALKDIQRRAHFEALHCHWTAIGSEVVEGHRKTLEEFSAQKFEGVMDARLQDLLDRIRGRADELLVKLKTKSGRDSVRRSLVGESQLIMAADLMLKQGDMEAYKGNWGVARACYERVLELAPTLPETQESRARAKAQLSDPTISCAVLGEDDSGMDAVGRAVDDQVL